MEIDFEFVEDIARSTPKAKALRADERPDRELTIIAFILCAVIYSLYFLPVLFDTIYSI